MERTNRAMETKKMKLLEKEVLCPYCMKKFKLGQVHFRTSKCFTLDEIREQNVKLSEMESDGIVAPAELEKEKKILNDMNRYAFDSNAETVLANFLEHWENRGWSTKADSDKMIVEGPDGYYEQPQTMRANETTLDKVRFLTLSEEHRAEWLYDEDGYLVGAAEAWDSDERRKETRARMCPHCHCLLPRDYGKYPVKIFAILGVRGSGKTVYLTELLRKIPNLGLLIAKNDTVDNFITKYQEANHQAYNGGTKPMIYPPMYLNFTLGRNDDPKTVILCDIAGEYCEDHNMLYGKYAGFMENVDSVLCLISPEQIKQEVEKEKEPAILFDKNDLLPTTQGGQQIELSQVLEVINAQEKKIRTHLWKMPFALTLSKSDVYTRASFRDINGNYEKKSDYSNAFKSNVSYPNGERSFREAEHKNDILEKVKKILDNRIRLHGYISCYKMRNYFAVSALGRPVGTGNENEETFCSYRVEEPFLWILSRWGWIDAEDDKFGNLFRKAVALLRRWRKL